MKTAPTPETWNTRLLLFILLFTTLSGAVRKWVVPGAAAGNIILFAQLLMPFVFALLFRPDPEATRRWHPALGLLGIVLVALAFNPLNKTVYHGAIGIVIHAGFWLLMLVYIQHRRVMPVERLSAPLLLLCAGQFALSYVQYILPADHVLNKYANEETVYAIAKVGNLIRATGTFSYLSGFGSFVTFVGLAVWGQGAMPQKPWYRWALMGMAILMSLFSGARAIILLTLLFSAFSLLPGWRPGRDAAGIVRTLLIAAAAGWALLQLPLFQLGVTNMQKRFTENIAEGETKGRIVESVAEVIHFRGSYPIAGIGLGCTYQGANALWGTANALEAYGYYEEEGERILLEGGYVLFVTRLALYLLVFSQLAGPWPYRAIVLILMLLYTNMAFNTYNTVFFFLGLAYVDRCYRMGESSETAERSDRR
jgi:hypothetical protein